MSHATHIPGIGQTNSLLCERAWPIPGMFAPSPGIVIDSEQPYYPSRFNLQLRRPCSDPSFDQFDELGYGQVVLLCAITSAQCNSLVGSFGITDY